MTAAPANRIGALKLLGESFRVLFAHFGVLFPLALAPALLIEALNLAVTPTAPAPDPGDAGIVFTPAMLVVSLAGALISYGIIALICLATLDALNGRRRGLDAYFRGALRHLLPLFVLGTILSVAAGIAAIFFVIPGVYVFAQFLVWVPAIVFEGAGMGALGRAQSLTSGHRWPLVGALLLLFVLLVGGMLAASPVFILAETGSLRLLASLASGALAAFFNALLAVFTTLVYLKLRALKEGVDAREIALPRS
jgi:hypothetical protein